MCLPSGKSKDSIERFQYLFKVALIQLANIPTPCIVPGLESTNLSCASCLCNWSTCLKLRKYPCNNVQERTCTLTNARVIKYANCLCLEMEQLLGAVTWGVLAILWEKQNKNNR